MDRNESEKIIKDTIEYANNEIKRNKRKHACISFSIIIIFLILFSFIVIALKFETSTKYSKDIINVVVPEDKGIDIKIDLPNYKNANAILVKTDDDYYDLYINITQTLISKVFKDNNVSDNLVRVGNGFIIDYKNEHILSYIPNGKDESAIKNIYYINKCNARIKSMDDDELSKIEKTLIWSNN